MSAPATSASAPVGAAAAAAAADVSAGQPLLAWEHMIAGARHAALAQLAIHGNAEAPFAYTDYVKHFHRHVASALPTVSPADDARIKVVASMDWYVHGTGANAMRSLYQDLMRCIRRAGPDMVDPIDMDTDLNPTLVYQLRTLHAHYPMGVWGDLRAWMAARLLYLDTDASEEDEDAMDGSAVARLYALHAMMQDVDGSVLPLVPTTAAVGDPSSSSSGGKRSRAPDRPLPARAGVAPWDGRLEEARRAGEQQAQDAVRAGWVSSGDPLAWTGDADDAAMPAFVRGFKASIHAAFPGADRALVAVEAQVAWEMRVFDQTADVDPIYTRLVHDMQHGAPSGRRAGVDPRAWHPYPGATHASHIVLRLRRIHWQYPAVWQLLLQELESAQSPSGRARVALFQSHMQRAMQVDVERGHFDASQLERHMAVQHRVPAALTNLIGQFATSTITAQAPIPVRLQVKHRLELLARRVTSFSPSETAAELRSILREVEGADAAAPARVLQAKKARKTD